MSASCRNTGFKTFTLLFESFIKFVKKTAKKYMEKNKYITFFLNTVYIGQRSLYFHISAYNIDLLCKCSYSCCFFKGRSREKFGACWEHGGLLRNACQFRCRMVKCGVEMHRLSSYFADNRYRPISMSVLASCCLHSR